MIILPGGSIVDTSKRYLRLLHFFGSMLLSGIAGAVLLPKSVHAIEPPLQFRLTFELKEKPVALTGVKIGEHSAVVVALEPNILECISSEGKEMWRRTISFRPENIVGAGDKILINAPPLLVCLNNQGTVVWQRRIGSILPQQLILNDFDGDREQEILYPKGKAVEIITLVGSYKSTIALPFVPRQILMVEKGKLVALGEHEVLCLNEQGERSWSFSLPRGFKPFYPTGNNLEPYPLLFLAQSKPTNQIVCQVFGSEGGTAITRLLVINIKNGMLDYVLAIDGICLSVVSLNYSQYLSIIDVKQKQSSIWQVDANWRVIRTHELNSIAYTTYTPLQFLLPFYGALLYIPVSGSINLLKPELTLTAVAPQRFGIKFSLNDIDRDGDDDILVAGSVPQADNRSALDFIINNIPENRSAAERLTLEAQVLLKQKNYEQADQKISLARSLYWEIGSDAQVEAIDSQRAILRTLERREKTTGVLIRSSLLTFIGLIVLLAVGYGTYPVAAKAFRIVRVRAETLLGRVRKPQSAATLKVLEAAFLHEMKKKLNKLKIALKEIDNGSHASEVKEFLATTLSEIQDKYDTHRPALRILLAKKSDVVDRMDRVLKSLEPGHFSHLNNQLIIKARESLEASSALLETVQQELSLHKYSIHQAVETGFFEIEKEKILELRQNRVSFTKVIPEGHFEKIIYYDDYEQWRNIFVNLLRNAVEAVMVTLKTDLRAEGQQRVGIQLSRSALDPKKALVVIEDSGCGMDENTQKHCFRRGFTSGKETGSGIGLTEETKRFIEERGTIAIESAVGTGTKFTIEIYNV